MKPAMRNTIGRVIRPASGAHARSLLYSAAARDYFARLDAAGVRVNRYDRANARLIDRLVANGGNFWPDSGAFNAMAGYLFPVEDLSIPPLYNKRMYFDGVDDEVNIGSLSISGKTTATIRWKTVFVGSAGANISIGSNNTGGSNPFLGYVDSGGGSTSYSSVGTPTIKVDGVAIGTSRDNLHDAINDGELHTIEYSNVDLTNWNGNFIFGHSNDSDYYKGTIFDVEIELDGNGTNDHEYKGYGNTDADWTDQIGSNDGTVNGSPALFTGQGVPGSTLIPLHPNHDAGTLNAFVTGDWNAVTGLKGDGSTKYVASNRGGSDDARDNFCAGVYASTAAQPSEVYFGNDPLVGPSLIFRGSTSGELFVRCQERSGANSSGGRDDAVGHIVISRDSSTNYILRVESTNQTISNASEAPDSDEFYVFARNSGGIDLPTIARLPFYHIGPNLNGAGELAELDSILTDWQTDLANA